MARMATDPTCIAYPVEEEVSKDAKDLIKDDDMVKLLSLAMDQGWQVNATNNGKLQWLSPDKSQRPVVSATRVMGRGLANLTASLAKAGLDISSLKPPKAKEQRSAVLVTNDPHAADKPLSEEEQFHADLQSTLADTLVALVEEMPDYNGKTDVVNSSIDVFLVQTGKALMEFMTNTNEAFSCSHKVDQDTKKRLEEAETLYLETQAALDNVNKQNEKLRQDLTRVGKEVQQALTERNTAMERANKAENKLRAFRSALMED